MVLLEISRGFGFIILYYILFNDIKFENSQPLSKKYFDVFIPHPETSVFREFPNPEFRFLGDSHTPRVSENLAVNTYYSYTLQR